MKFEIKSQWNGSILFSLETASFKMCVEAGVKRGAYLRGADLQGADLQGADLQGADLQGAYLQGAEGINSYILTPLLFLLDQPGKIRAYKLINADDQGPIKGGITYEIGKSYHVENANCDVLEQCAAGISLATLDWCMKEWKENYRILIAEFTAKDIAAIPTATDGKFRVHRCKIVGEKDLVEIGLIPSEAKDQKADTSASAPKKRKKG
jgi:hypothetical protein